ncbi:MAG: hypothetical protein ACTSU5_13535 [Promethearchaeota archaeon]
MPRSRSQTICLVFALLIVFLDFFLLLMLVPALLGENTIISVLYLFLSEMELVGFNLVRHLATVVIPACIIGMLLVEGGNPEKRQKIDSASLSLVLVGILFLVRNFVVILAANSSVTEPNTQTVLLIFLVFNLITLTLYIGMAFTLHVDRRAILKKE